MVAKVPDAQAYFSDGQILILALAFCLYFTRLLCYYLTLLGHEKVIHFAHLNETNYPGWAMKMQAHLTRLGLWDVVIHETGTDAEEDPEEENKALAAWQKKRTPRKMAEARAEIILRVEDSQLPFMQSPDPMEIWKLLAQVHIAQGLTTRLALRRQFTRLAKTADETMAAWVGRVKGYSFKLEAIGIEVTDEDRVLTLTNGLDDSYKAFISSIDKILVPEMIALGSVVDRMLNEETRRGASRVKAETASPNTQQKEFYQWQIMSPGGSRRSGDRNDQPQQIGPDDLAVAGSGSVSPRPLSKAGDHNFDKISRPSPMTFGSFNEESKWDSLSRVCSNTFSNMFSQESEVATPNGGSPESDHSHSRRTGVNLFRADFAHSQCPNVRGQSYAESNSMKSVALPQATANRWDWMAMDLASLEIVHHKVKALLKRLTMENFDSISDQIISCVNKSEKEKDGRTLIHVSRLVFEEAVDEALCSSKMYARLCRKMMEKISPLVHDDGIRNAENKPIPGGLLFRKYLLDRCQEDFERGWVATGDEIMLSSDKYATLKARRQGLGLIKFICELFKVQMLMECTMHECAQKLLRNVDNPNEEEIESLCELLTTIGALLDVPKARAHMDVYFQQMRKWTKNQNVSSRMRCILQDIIELRERKWVPNLAPAHSPPPAAPKGAVSPTLRSTLTTVRYINDLKNVAYPEGIQRPKIELNTNAKNGKFRYDRDFLLQFMKVCKHKPDRLPSLEEIGLEPDQASPSHSMSRGGSKRHRQGFGPIPVIRQASMGLGFGPSVGSGSGTGFSMGNSATPLGALKLNSGKRFNMSNDGLSASVSDHGQFSNMAMSID